MTFISIAAGGVAKTLAAVTISLHPGAVQLGAVQLEAVQLGAVQLEAVQLGAVQPGGHDAVVRRGDSLSLISLHEYGTAADWPALWWANRRQVPDASLIVPGQRLFLPGYPKVSPWLIRAARAAIGASPAALPHPAAAAPRDAEAAQTVARVAARPATYSVAGGSFQSCVIQRESGGNPAAVNPASGAGGLYGFLPSTWHGLGFSGLPENASVATQNAAFAKEYAQSGTSAWAPYDGC